MSESEPETDQEMIELWAKTWDLVSGPDAPPWDSLGHCVQVEFTHAWMSLVHPWIAQVMTTTEDHYRAHQAVLN